MTFRVEEVGVEAEDMKEEPTNLNIEAGAGPYTEKGRDPTTDKKTEIRRGNIGSGMPASQQALALEELMKSSHGRSTRSTWSISKRGSTETLQDTTQKNLRTGRELGVPAQEGRDP